MIVMAYFTENNVAKTGLTPVITIWDVDDDVNVKLDQPMVETGHAGFYKYDFADIDITKAYSVSCDAGSTLESFDRYTYGVITPKDAKQPYVSFGNGG